MSEQRKAIIIATGMDNTALGKSLRTMVQDVKLAGEQIKRGFMPASMQGDLVAYYRRMGVASGAAFKTGQKEGKGEAGLAGAAGFGKEALGAIGVGFGMEAVNALMEKADGISNMAALTGMTAENIQRIDIAFQRMGISVEAGNSSLEKLNTKVGEARNGSADAQAAFEKWGIAIEGKDNAEIVAEISGKMKEMADPAERSAMAVDLMGKSGKDLVPLLMQGAEAMKQIGDHGPILSDQDLEAIKTLHESLSTFVNYLEIGLGKIFGWIAKIAQFLGKLSTGPETYGKSEAEAFMHPEDADAEKNRAAATEKTQQQINKKAEAQKKADHDRAEWRKQFEKDYHDTVRKLDEEKAKRDREADEKKKRTVSDNRRLRALDEEHAKAKQEIDRIDQGGVTLEQLAGRRYSGRLDKAYGKGGRYDLESGNGPFSGIARDALLAGKQQQWDIIHGNAQFDAKGTLIGGAAFEDKERQKRDENMLGQAGIETPAMKQAQIEQHLGDINKNIEDLLDAAKTDGIVLKDDQ